jgi:hypothetical protein
MAAMTTFGARSAGFDDHIVKPADPDEVVQRIDRRESSPSAGVRTTPR